MGSIEDVRKVLQDFLAPELRAITARLDAIEQRFTHLEHRFDRLENKLDANQAQVMTNILQLLDVQKVKDRLAVLEAGSETRKLPQQ